jgi:hypothetical protein
MKIGFHGNRTRKEKGVIGSSVMPSAMPSVMPSVMPGSF